MWNILCVEDMGVWAREVEREIDKVVAGDEYKFEVCEYAFDPPSEEIVSAYDFLESNEVHILVADSHFEGQDIYEVPKYDIQYGSDVLGVALIRSFLDERYPVHFIFTTAYDDDITKDVPKEWDKLLKENHKKVTNIRKNEETFREWDYYDKLSEVFRSVARELCQRMSPNEKMQLLEKAESRPDFSSEDIVVCGEEWSVESFLAGWRESGRDLSRVAKDLVTPDLSLASSRAFAIWGVKAITHPIDEYFPNDSSLIADEARRQIEEFKKKTEGVPDDDIETDVRRKILDNISNFSLPEEATFSSQARRERMENFQFKGEIKGDYPEGKICSEISYLVEKSNIEELKTFRINTNTYDESEIELHLPVHKYLKDELSNLLDSISSQGKGAGANSVEVAFRREKTGRTDVKEGSKAEIYKNYIVFRNKGEMFPKRKITKDPATVLVSLSQSNISTYGKFYIATSSVEEENYELFDCTHHPPQNVDAEGVFPEKSKVPSLLKNKGEYVTYYIFAFSCWRPNLHS